MKEKKTIEETIKDLNKKYEGNSVMKVGNVKHADVESFPTGCYSLDNIFSCGGLPKGRIIEIYGQPSAGKTSMALFILGQVQRQGGKAMFVDAEMSFSRKFAEKLGVNVDDLYLNSPTTGEEGLNIVDEMTKTGKMDVIVVDSVSSLIPAKELEGGIEKESYALQARMMSRGLRILTGTLSQNKTTLIFINQIRMKIGAWGNPETTSGGRSLKFYCSCRLEVKGKKIKDKKDEVIGSQLSITCTKNKTGVPWRKAELDLYFDNGIDLVGDILNVAIREEIIEKVGNTYSYGKEKLGVGLDQSKEFLKKNPEVVDKIKKELDKKLKQ